MKNTFKKFAGIAAASIMAASMVAPMAMNFTASATQVSISSTDKETHTYSAYQIFAGDYTSAGLTVTGWGTGINTTGLFADAAWTGFVYDGTNTIGDETDAAVVAQYLEKVGDKSEEADKLAAIIAKYATGTSTPLSSTAVDLGAGYYLVVDSYASSDSDGSTQDATSKLILRVSGATDPIVIETKKSYPSVIKKVKENANTDSLIATGQTFANTTNFNVGDQYNDVADYNIGDSVPFKLYGTLPETLTDYDAYYYKMTDTLASQFTAPTADKVKVYIDGVEVAQGGNLRVTVTGQVITIEFEDIRAAGAEYGDIVTVEYEAVLNNSAVIGLDGQMNEVYLTYSNNPNVEYAPNVTDENKETDNSTDDTPVDKVIVFTYELDVTKVDKATGAKLTGAEFTLKNEAGEYAKVKDGVFVDWVADVVTDDAGSTTLTSGTGGLFTIKGIDEGTYTLTETKAPTEAYNKLTKPITVTLTASTANVQNWNDFVASNALTGLTIKVDEKAATEVEDTKKGIAKMEVENSKGTELPSTGGIGTTLFYLGGGAMVAVAGVYLISKKRMKNED